MSQLPQPQPQPEESHGEAASQPQVPSEQQLRIGGAERDDAISLLQEHMTAGRLDSTEFDDRIAKALSAKTGAELDELFTDLPGRRPGQNATSTTGYGQEANPYGPTNPAAGKEVAHPYGTPYPVKRDRQQFHWMAPGVLVPIAVVLCFVLGWHLWFLIPIAAIVGSQLSYHGGRRNRDRHRVNQEQHAGQGQLPQVGADDAARITDLIHSGRKIHAIKAYREATGADLVTAKNAIENWGETLR